MEIRFDNHSTEEFFEWMAKKVSELSIPLLKQSLESEIEGEVLLGRKEVCDQVLNCSVDTADKHFLYRIGKKPVQFGQAFSLLIPMLSISCCIKLGCGSVNN